MSRGNQSYTTLRDTIAPHARSRFPKIRIGDDVQAQHKFLVDQLGLCELALVIGGSMGGQQVYEWAVRYPDMVKRAAIIAATARTSHHQVNFVDTLREALTSDPAFNQGRYERASDVGVGLDRMAKIVASLGWSAEFYQKERWRIILGMSSITDFMNGVMKAYFQPMDPNVLLAQMWK
ncbi:alpha/beta fold hydrolase [Rhizobium lemnae]|uniref:Alpha/beta fold hydrolase n=1 Tax=Rhizobium lemnae TaxID=1214924 RepID=A0ABV8EE29_9HYPH|nr:alpha/beta fold hydrolase [Rhizobium lemnae]MCJ8509933.1 alpha/beta fold hydrolase [Rhizobium lemnae]